MRDNVHHVEIRIDSTAVRTINDPGFKYRRQTFQEIRIDQCVEFFDPRQKERVLIFAGGSRGSKVPSHVEISNSAEEHYSFDEQKE